MNVIQIFLHVEMKIMALALILKENSRAHVKRDSKTKMVSKVNAQIQMNVPILIVDLTTIMVNVSIILGVINVNAKMDIIMMINGNHVKIQTSVQLKLNHMNSNFVKTEYVQITLVDLIVLVLLTIFFRAIMDRIKFPIAVILNIQ